MAGSPEPYPIFLRLADRPVLVVGGGAVASSKLRGLLDAGARVTLVAPHVRLEAVQPGVEIVRREFRPEDVDGQWLVVAAAPPHVNRAVALAAEERRVFVNAVDDSASATALLGGVVRKGGVTVAISTGGRAPALAGLLREALEAVLPAEVDDWIATAEALRERWRAEGIPIAGRRPLLLRALDELYANGRSPNADRGAP